MRGECRKRNYRQFAPDTSGPGTANSDAEPFTDSNGAAIISTYKCTNPGCCPADSNGKPFGTAHGYRATVIITDEFTRDDSFAERRAGIARARKRAADAFADTCREFVSILCGDTKSDS